MNYNRIFYWSDPDNAYIVSVPTLPGCMADGETIGEALANADVAIDEWISFAKELGNDIPPEDPVEIESSSPSISDVAAYILSKYGSMTTMKLEKLAYYCQAWCLGLYQRPIAACVFEDWANGPVCRELFYSHKGNRFASSSTYSSEHIFTDTERHFIDSVLSVYANKDAAWLSALTHKERPWKDARGDIPAGYPDSTAISNSSMSAFYGLARR